MRHTGVRRVLPVALTFGLLVLAIPAGNTAELPGGVDSESTTISAAGGPYAFLWEWSPAEVTISKGERVTWINPTSATHHITSWDGRWDVAKHLDTDATVTLRFKRPGVYRYWCDVSTHADIVYVGTERFCVGMCGVITVE